MSCRYWSNAPEGVVRKKAFALPFDLAIRELPALSPEFVCGNGGQRRHLGRLNHANIGFTANPCKSTQFSTSQIVGFVAIPEFVHYPQYLWKIVLRDSSSAWFLSQSEG